MQVCLSLIVSQPPPLCVCALAIFAVDLTKIYIHISKSRFSPTNLFLPFSLNAKFPPARLRLSSRCGKLKPDTWLRAVWRHPIHVVMTIWSLICRGRVCVTVVMSCRDKWAHGVVMFENWHIKVMIANIDRQVTNTGNRHLWSFKFQCLMDLYCSFTHHSVIFNNNNNRVIFTKLIVNKKCVEVINSLSPTFNPVKGIWRKNVVLWTFIIIYWAPALSFLFALIADRNDVQTYKHKSQAVIKLKSLFKSILSELFTCICLTPTAYNALCWFWRRRWEKKKPTHFSLKVLWEMFPPPKSFIAQKAPSSSHLAHPPVEHHSQLPYKYLGEQKHTVIITLKWDTGRGGAHAPYSARFGN